MYYPARQDYQLTIRLKLTLFDRFFWNRKILIDFKEGTLREFFEFEEIKHDEVRLLEWLENFINSHYHKPVPFRLYYHCANLILNKLTDNLFVDGYKKQEKKPVKDTDDVPAPFSSVIAVLAERLGIMPHILIEEYTIRQFLYILDGLVWNVNEQTDEGKKENRAKARNKLIDREKVKKVKEQHDQRFNKFKEHVKNQSGSSSGGQQGEQLNGQVNEQAEINQHNES